MTKATIQHGDTNRIMGNRRWQQCTSVINPTQKGREKE